MSKLIDVGSQPEEKLLRKKQAAEKLACSSRTIDRLVIAGSLSRVKILGGVRFRWSQVQELMKGTVMKGIVI